MPYHSSPQRISFMTNPGICNLSCDICRVHSPLNKEKVQKNHILDISIIEKVLHELKPRGLKEVIPSTMGEPLLYPDFERLIDLVDSLGLKFNITTNGTFPILGVNPWARKLVPVCSDLKVSINNFPNSRIQNNLLEYIEYRNSFFNQSSNYSRISIQTAVMMRNLNSLPQLLLWAISAGVNRVKFNQLVVTWPEFESESLSHSEISRRAWNLMVDELSAIQANNLQPNGKVIELVNLTYFTEEENRANTSKDQSKKACPFLGREAWIDEMGTFHPCPANQHVNTGFINFGSVNQDNFSQLWMNSAYQNFMENHLENECCQKCLFCS